VLFFKSDDGDAFAWCSAIPLCGGLDAGKLTSAREHDMPYFSRTRSLAIMSAVRLRATKSDSG
jgi:hypothetical protein